MAKVRVFNDTIEILSDTDDDEEIQCVEVSLKKKAPKNVSAIVKKKSAKVADEDEDLTIVGSSCMKISSSAAKNSKRPEVVDVLENRARQLRKLVEEYGEYELGWGMKVTNSQVGESSVASEVSFSIFPSPHYGNSPTAPFELVVALPGNVRTLGPFQNFPPIRVRMEYSSIYHNEARFFLTCSWLLKDHLKRLSEEMQRNYDNHGHDLNHVVQFLERKCIKFLGIIHHGRITYTSPMIPNRKHTDISYEDPSVIGGIFQELHFKLTSFAGTSLLDSKTFECGICFDRKPVMAVILFLQCKHFFCRACVTAEFGLKIGEGRVKNICCLSDKCQTPAETELIKLVVDPPTFRRYCDMTSESYVDQSSMFVRCPRKECSAPMEIIPNGPRDIVCLACQYQFCGDCKAASHPNQPCLTDEQKTEIRTTWKTLNEEGQKAMEKRFGAANIRFAFQDAESEEWISKNAKCCPVCKTHIEKYTGCNKVVCTGTGCGTFFCWLCLKVLPKDNPYGHFAVGASECSGRLHEGNPLAIAPPPFRNLFGNVAAERMAAVLNAHRPAAPLPVFGHAPMQRPEMNFARLNLQHAFDRAALPRAYINPPRLFPAVRQAAVLRPGVVTRRAAAAAQLVRPPANVQPARAPQVPPANQPNANYQVQNRLAQLANAINGLNDLLGA